MSTPATLDEFARLTAALSNACATFYGDRLVSLAIFGSVGRGAPRPDSDIDVLIVADPLPRGRLARVSEFRRIESTLAGLVSEVNARGVFPEWSPVLKTPAEVGAGSPLFLDMIEDATLLFDREGFLRASFDRFRHRLDRLGAKRIWRGHAWYWDLKPDYRHGEVFEL